MTQYIELPWLLERDSPPFTGNEIKFPESLVRHLLKKHTKKGGNVFDPFAGLGTTLFVAEEIGRIPFGIEANEQQQQWIAGQLENWTHLVCDDAANLQKYNFPKMDLILTSPPYMPRHHKWNPLYGGDPKHAGYDKYLRRLKFIFSKLPAIMKKSTPLIVQVDNIKSKRGFTPLIHDIAHVLQRDFIQTDETIVRWNNAPKDYPFTTLLAFRKK